MADQEQVFENTIQRKLLHLIAWTGIGFLIIPVFLVVPMSFSNSRFLEFPPEVWSIRWYENFVENSTWLRAAWVSIRVAVLTCLVATPLGVLAAYGISQARKSVGDVLSLILLLPIMVPLVISAIGLFYVYAQVGILGSLYGIALAHTMLALPFVVVITLSGFKTFDPDQERVAWSLGASKFQTFIRITLPQIKVSVFSSALIAFITSLDEVVIALFVSGGANTTLTKRMFTAIQVELDPTVAAISSILIIVSLIVALIHILGSYRKQEKL